MKQHLTLYLFCFLMVSLSACRKDSYFEDKDTTIRPPSVYYLISISGVVTNRNNLPLHGAEVFVGELRMVTDKNGVYLFRNIRVPEDVTVINIKANGYESRTHLFLPEKGRWFRQDFALNQKYHTATFSSTEGISVVLAKQARLDIPSNAIQLFSGAPYSGEVRILAEFLDPMSVADMADSPGLFLSGNGLENKKSILSHGVLHVRMETPTGVKIKLKPDYKALFRAPVLPALLQQSDLGASIWYLNESNGNWNPGPTIQRNGAFFETSVSELSWITYGKSIECTWLSGNLSSFNNVAFNQNPLEIRIGEFYQSRINPAADGRFRFLVPMHNSVKLRLKSDCNSDIYSRDFNSVVAATELGTIKVNSGAGQSTFSGGFIFCDDKKHNAYLLIQTNNGNKVLFPDAQNVFSGIFDHCTFSGQMNMSIVNASAGKVSTAATITGNNQFYVLGQLELCDENNMISSHAFVTIGSKTYFSTITDACLKKIEDISLHEYELNVSSLLNNSAMEFEFIMFDLKEGFSMNPPADFQIEGVGAQFLACNLPAPDCDVELVILDYSGLGSTLKATFRGSGSGGFVFEGGFNVRVVEKK